MDTLVANLYALHQLALMAGQRRSPQAVFKYLLHARGIHHHSATKQLHLLESFPLCFPMSASP